MTLNNVKKDEVLHISGIFKIKLVGENKLTHIFGTSSISIFGDGSLTVDSTDFHSNAVGNDNAAITCEKIEISNESTVKLYARESVIYISDSKKADNLIVLKNGDDISNKIVTTESYKRYENIDVAIPGSTINMHFSHTATKDGKKYGVDYYANDGRYIVYSHEIYLDTVNNLYLFDDNENEEPINYNNLEELTAAGYQLINEDINVTSYSYVISDVYEGNNKTYAVFDNNIYEITPNYFNSKRPMKDKIYYVKKDTTASLDSLNKKVKETIYDTKVNLKELVVKPKKITNPSTGNKTLLITIIIGFASTIVYSFIKKQYSK